MENKKELDMTVQEKKDFVTVLNDGQMKLIEFYKKSIRKNSISTLIFILVGIVIAYFLKIKLAIFVPIYVALSLFTYIATFSASYLAMNRVLKNASKGKINYWKYRKIEKSGELDKWIKGEFVENPKETDLEKNDNEDLTAEEMAVLKKLINKKGISNFDDIDSLKK